MKLASGIVNTKREMEYRSDIDVRSGKTPPLVLELTAEDHACIDGLAHDLLQRFTSLESPEFLQATLIAAQELPRRIRNAIVDFRLAEQNAALIIHRIEVDDEALGPTPSASTSTPERTRALDARYLIFASLLGHPIGWASNAAGSLLHDIAPFTHARRMQTGMSSEVDLQWHTEEAYHPLRPDFFGLCCLRNSQRVPTTLAQARDLELSDETQTILRRPIFRINRDDGHQVRGASTDPASVLFGDIDAPYLRADPAYMDEPEEPETKAALHELYTSVQDAMQNIPLAPGEILFVNNHLAVHGRRRFQARFDGTDRWLRRLWLASDLRPSRHLRTSATARIIEDSPASVLDIIID